MEINLHKGMETLQSSKCLSCPTSLDFLFFSSNRLIYMWLGIFNKSKIGIVPLFFQLASFATCISIINSRTLYIHLRLNPLTSMYLYVFIHTYSDIQRHSFISIHFQYFIQMTSMHMFVFIRIYLGI